MLCHVNTQMVLLPYHFFLFEAFRSNCRGHHNNLGIPFLELVQQLWRETLSFLFQGLLELQPEVLADQGWRSNKSCQRTALPDMKLTITREPQHRCSCSLTRVWMFFQINSVQRSPQLAHVCLRYGRTGIDNCHGALDSNDFQISTICRIFVAGSCSDLLASLNTCSPARRSGGTNFFRSARSRRMSSRCCTSR